MPTTAAHPAQRFTSRIATADALRAWDGDDDLCWIADGERDELNRLTHPRRRNSFLEGRWLAKQLIREFLFSAGQMDASADESALSAIAINTRDEKGESVRPTIRVRGAVQPWGLSLSHTETAVAAVFSSDANLLLGVDLTVETAHAPGFIETWFTADEQEYLKDAAGRETTVFWTTKEAVYKAINTGERFTPRSIHVSRDADGALSARYRGYHVMQARSNGTTSANGSGQLIECAVPGHVSIICICDQTSDTQAAAGWTAEKQAFVRPTA